MKKDYSLFFILCLIGCLSSCNNDDYGIPEGRECLQNDCIKRSLGPNLVGNQIEFAYAMALGKEHGKLVSARVEATVAGASGTYMENQSYHTGVGGNDVGIEIGAPSVTNGKVTEVSFTRDTCAATLRYYYVIPEEARGKNVSFTFSAKDSNGNTVHYDMGPYTVSGMDMKLDMVMKNNSCFSIADMAVYNDVSTVSPDKIDLIYLYRDLDNVPFLHSMVSAAAEKEYLPDITLPPGAGNLISLLRTYGAIDQQLARDQYGVFIDDLDFREIKFDKASNAILNMKKDAGMWTESADGQYRAFVYINQVDNDQEEITISVKRLKIK